MRRVADMAATPIAAYQRSFAEALWRPDAPVPAGIAGASARQIVKRFGVYRNNVHASLLAAVAARFPVIERLVGTEFFRAMALAFIERHPPASPVLLEYGGSLPDFVRRFPPARDLPYLADVARLEWARNAAYHAADGGTLAISALGEVHPAALAEVKLELHPAATLVASSYPIVSIWRTNTHDEVVERIGPERAAECALVTRPGLDVLVTALPVACTAFVRSLQQGQDLGTAASDATEGDPAFDLSAALAVLFTSGAVGRIVASSEERNPKGPR